MKIEVLYPEIANLYGDLENIDYLKKSYPEIEISKTHLNDEPLFVSEKPDLVYMGTMTESAQLLVIEKLRTYKDALRARIDDGTLREMRLKFSETQSRIKTEPKLNAWGCSRQQQKET